MTAWSRPPWNAASSPSSTTVLPKRLRSPRAVATTRPAAAGRAAVPGTSAPGAACSPRRADAASTTTDPVARRAVAWVPIPARSSSSSGRRSQPPRPTTIVSLSAPSRPHSSDTRPSRIRTMRSAMRVDSGSWLTITVVQPCSRTSSASVAYTWSAVAASSSPVGSSARNTRGRWASAAHSATRCCSPPESCAGNRSRFAASPTRSSSSSARRTRSEAFAPRSPSCSATSSRAVSSGESARA